MKSLGGLTGSDRRPSQTDTALFFADNAVLYWNRTLRTIAEHDLADPGDTARMFALVNMAMADALISAWDSKRHVNYWRPITAIRLGDIDGNSRTAADPAWTPFIATPNYPDYTSGANALSGAATTMLANFFGTDTFTFTMTSAFVHPVTKEAPQNPRMYSRFSDAADDVVDARISRAFISARLTRMGAVRASTSRTGRSTISSDRCTEIIGMRGSHGCGFLG